MSSGIFGSIPTGQMTGSSMSPFLSTTRQPTDPFAGTMGGATQIGPTQSGGSQTDPFAGQMGGPSTINMFASPFGSTPYQGHSQPFKNVQQNLGGQGSGGGQSSGGSSSSSSPMSMIGQAAKMVGSVGGVGGVGAGGSGSQGSNSNSPFSQGMWANMAHPQSGAQVTGGQGGGLMGKISNWMNQGGNMGAPSQGTPNQVGPNGMPLNSQGQIVNDGGNMGPLTAGTPNQFSASGYNITPTGTVAFPQGSNGGMLNNLTQLPTGGMDGGMGNIGSFLGGLF